MSIPVPTSCANRECRAASVRPIHCSSQKVAIDAVEGMPVYSHLITYRCAQCGNTWAVRAYSAEDLAWQAKEQRVEARGALPSGRGW